MAARNKRQEKRHNVIEFLKKDCTDWSSSTDTGISDFYNPIKLKTLPQAHGHEIKKVIADLKAALPDVNPNDVRRFYIPYYEAILLELHEQGYEEAHRYMVEFLKLDDRISEQTPGMMSWKKPYLKDQKDFINCLKNGFVAFEKSKRKGDLVMRATALLDTALFFQSRTWEWWWIAERLYETAISAAEEIESDAGQTITLIRYLYGRFLFDELQKPTEALGYLKLAREVSEKKIWNASKKLGTKEGTIFKESNIFLFKILLILAQNDRPVNPASALKSAIDALERAQDAGNPVYVNEAYYELGKCYVAANDIKRALQCFSKLLALAKRIADIEGICNAHMELAFAYKHLNDNDNTERHLKLCRENAENLGLMEKLAHAHYYTGEHFLSQGKLHMSTSHLDTAFNLYKRLDLPSDADRARCIAGISKGQEKIEKYIDILLRSGECEQNATLKLCRWRSRRETFWIEDTTDAKSEYEVQYEGSNTISSSLSSGIDNNQLPPRP